MMRSWFTTNIIRFLMICFWGAIFFLFLLSPTFTQFFREERSLRIFTWPLLLDAQYLTQFEKETGITLYISYYESSDELFSKLRATKGYGYDLVIPSDHTVALLQKEGLLKKLDRSKLTFLKYLEPKLLGNYYDPHNDYSIPYFWGVYGLGIDMSFFGDKKPKASWDLVFNKDDIPASISMTDNAREAILMAAQYLFGSIDNLTEGNRLQRIEVLLRQQKQWVELYTDTRADDLLASHSCPVVVALGPDIKKTKNKYENVDFLIPKEGSFIVVDALVIPIATNKDDLIYQFINYLYRPDVLKHHLDLYGLCSPTTNVQEEDQDSSFCPNEKQFRTLDFFRNVLPEKELNDLWIRLMAY